MIDIDMRPSRGCNLTGLMARDYHNLCVSGFRISPARENEDDCRIRRRVRIAMTGQPSIARSSIV